jgi:hypothetical protein
MDRIQRRDFLIAAATIVAAPIVARAQAKAIPRIGFLFGGT